MIKQLSDGRWRVDVEPVKGKRHRKTLPTKAEARRYESYIRANYSKNPDWNLTARDRRRLRELIDRWYLLHGQTLTDGERRRNSLYVICTRLGNPIASALSGNVYTAARGIALANGTAGKTLNNHLGSLKAI